MAQEIIRLRKARTRRGPKKLPRDLQKHHRGGELPAISTIAHSLSREGLAKKAASSPTRPPGVPRECAAAPNDIWAADYKGQFLLRNGQYCFPLTVGDLYPRYLLGCEAHPEVSLQRNAVFCLAFSHVRACPIASEPTTDPSLRVPWRGCHTCRPGGSR